eukprot:CAMPEP_0113938668 /NCGR_PEP_ID=MMETSP1339-20121228/5096_1 /TAXON_ID=94617 /ORGANISM="Fibrocapsa japonica" /LENGTH=140 /DNA_ID=CAMNT_0000941899 /DNA_START=74 /DNA_END=496 /DNA_ORIENTATION=- /assembly_acc=CAM_ASM_000762
MGFAYGHPDLIQLMNNCKAPYNVNKLTEEVAVKALSNLDQYEENVAKILQEKKRMLKALSELPFVKKIHDTDSNFILFQVDHAKEIYLDMANRGVVIRYRGSEVHCPDCLRATVGTAEENDEMLKLLQDSAAKMKIKFGK